MTDHSATHGFGNHVTPDELKRQIERVAKVNDQIEGITVLAGTETNVLPDGSVDYEDDLLAQLDWVVASVHTSFNMREENMTEARGRGAGAPAGRRARAIPPAG